VELLDDEGGDTLRAHELRLGLEVDQLLTAAVRSERVAVQRVDENRGGRGVLDALPERDADTDRRADQHHDEDQEEVPA
jgi:hypothetical protein